MSARAYVLIEAAGNRFALADGFAEAPPEDPAAVARALAGRVDGLLLLDPPTPGAAPARDANGGSVPARARMTLYNTDGTRPEACGNGLRCIAAVAVEEGHVPAVPFAVETDAGPCALEVTFEHARVVRARAGVGPVRLGEPFTFEHAGVAHEVYPADVGNPHAVVFVSDVAHAPLAVLGPALERHPRFPHRTNVELVGPIVARPGTTAAIDARVWERGVGETGACGTGACAAAVVAALRRDLAPPIDVRMPGGELRVSWSDLSAVHLEGPVHRLGTIRA